MGSYHFHMTQVKRSAGQSVVAAAAYRSGEKLQSTYYGEINDYTRKKGIVMSEIFLPEHAPREFSDRETLWNSVEWIELNRKAQLAHNFDISLMNEFTMEENIAMAKAFVQEELVARGMIVDLAIHDPVRKPGEEANPHMHILVPIRPLNEDGSWGIKQKKVSVLDGEGNPVFDKNGKQCFRAVQTTDWSSKETLLALRRSWADRCNALYAEKGLTERVDDRSYMDLGIGQIPTIHEGPNVRAMEAKGIQTALGNLNRMIRFMNGMAAQVSHLKNWIQEKIGKLKEELQVHEQPTLAGYLQQYYDERNQVAQTFEYGTRKAMLTNLKDFASAISFLTAKKLETPEQLKQRIDELDQLYEKTKAKMKSNNKVISETKNLQRHWKNYQELKPLYEEYQKKFLGKDKFYKEHKKQLDQFQMARRIVLGKQDENGKIPTGKWEQTLENANALNQELEAEKEKILSELSPLKKVQRCVDQVMNEVEEVSGSSRNHQRRAEAKGEKGASNHTKENVPGKRESVLGRLAEKQNQIEKQQRETNVQKKHREMEL